MMIVWFFFTNITYNRQEKCLPYLYGKGLRLLTNATDGGIIVRDYLTRGGSIFSAERDLIARIAMAISSSQRPPLNGELSFFRMSNILMIRIG